VQRDDFLQRGPHGLGHGRIVEEDLVTVSADLGDQVGRRLTVGDHDDLFRTGPVGQEAPAEEQAVLHVVP